ncbi:homocysteine S-methyltransferase family protein [Dongia sedimenti]|uniref:Homocysteine S-methyltransferase family protein n=1 Tax=Dongia sedimenti TaxID=3064282 RepID=A0ABU0YRP0_9PROT|nr:homocysteine S-methyltransferase family protein [Rhodospirillaceae bacterium R-7]
MSAKLSAKYRFRLPQLGHKLFLTDAGLETILVFHEGVDLPCFASFPLLNSEPGTRRLRDYYAGFAKLAVSQGVGLILEGATWRANPDWGAKLGFDAKALAEINRKSVALMLEVRSAFETAQSPMPISGNIGPRGDGYDPGKLMTAKEAEDYHGTQVAVLADTQADYVSAFTITNTPEAIGIVRAATRAKVPAVISFTLETDGKLPTGQALKDAIAEVDAATESYATYFMINCAHPTHFDRVLDKDAAWVKRIRGIRANASCRSHAELDSASDLDAGNPAELGRQYAELLKHYPHLTVLGGCCGTDFRHVEAISHNCVAAKAA